MNKQFFTQQLAASWRLSRVLCLCLIPFIAGCASKPCAYVAFAEKICLAPLPAQPVFAHRSELVVASSPQGPLTALAETQWQTDRYASAVTTPFGQRLYVLQYDGQKITFEQSDLPLPIRAENVLLDTQLMWWPLPLLRAQLPAAARLIETEENGVRVRELWWQDKMRVRIVFARDEQGAFVQYHQLGLDYQLVIKEIPDA